MNPATSKQEPHCSASSHQRRRGHGHRPRPVPQRRRRRRPRRPLTQRPPVVPRLPLATGGPAAAAAVAGRLDGTARGAWLVVGVAPGVPIRSSYISDMIHITTLVDVVA